MLFNAAVAAFCILCVGGTVALVHAVHGYRRRHPTEGDPEVQSVFVGSVITFFGVFAAFMVVTTWTEYSQGLSAVSAEATSLFAVYRLSSDLPSPDDRRMRTLCAEYAQAMVSDEWPAMTRNESSAKASAIAAEMWRVLTTTGPDGLKDLPSREELLRQFIEMTKLRGQRLVVSRTNLPRILHAVLGLSALIVIAALVGLETRDERRHVIEAGVMALLVSLSLATIWGLDQPYSRGIKVPPSSFELALKVMRPR
jgi:hypothetical protein